MSNPDHSNQGVENEPQGFPVELKILLAVIASGIIALALKVAGII